MHEVKLQLDCGNYLCNSCRFSTDGHEYCSLFQKYCDLNEQRNAIRLVECKNAETSEA